MTVSLGKMVEALCMQQEMLVWVDSFAIGRNKGGRLVSFFSKRLEKRALSVYEEKWNRFPPDLMAIVESAPSKEFEIPSNRDAAEAMGLTAIKPTQILRYKRTTKANADGKWVFHSVLRTMNIPDTPLTLLTSAIEQRYPDVSQRSAYVMKALQKAEVEKMSDLTDEQCAKWLQSIEKANAKSVEQGGNG